MRMFSKIALHFFRQLKPLLEAGVPLLETERLRLRAPRRSDFPHILELGSDPEVMRYITHGKTQTEREAKSDLERRIVSSQQDHGYWIMEEKHSGDFVGWVMLRPMIGGTHFELGYRLLRKYWGKGYATEGSQRLLKYGSAVLELSEIRALAMPENGASRRVMEKLGFTFIGHQTYHDTHCVVYQLLLPG